MAKKRKPWVLWLIVGITFLIAVGLICLSLYVKNSTAIIVFIVIDFIIMTFSLNAAISTSFKYKPKPKKYLNKAFKYDTELLIDNLLKNGFKEKKVRYGNVYMKILGVVAYKITIITNASEYLNTDNNQNKTNTTNNDLKKCQRFIGCEVFLDYNDPDNKILKNIADFSFQGKNIYYEAFYFDKEANTLHEPNIITISEDFKEDVKRLKNEYLMLIEEI